jgi:hypothetical protein
MTSLGLFGFFFLPCSKHKTVRLKTVSGHSEERYLHRPAFPVCFAKKAQLKEPASWNIR